MDVYSKFFSGILLPLCLLVGCANEKQNKAGDTYSGETHPSESAVDLPQQVPRQAPLAQLLKPGQTISLLVDKSAYQMAVLKGREIVKIYPVVFGFGAGPDKLREGDGATPEGRFHIQKKYPHPQWRYFLWLNYPTPDSWRKHKAAKASGKLPMDAGIGSEIGIHGVPLEQNDWIDQRKNWTAGCVSLKNPDLIELYPWIQNGTEVRIVP